MTKYCMIILIVTYIFSALCQNVECKFGARCSAGECICPLDCSAAGSEPVCSNSMITYSNECELQKAACDLPKGHKQLHVIFYGDCEDRFAVAGPPIALSKCNNFISSK